MIELPEPKILCPFCEKAYLEQHALEGFEGDEVLGVARCPHCQWEGTVVYTVQAELLDKFTHKPIPVHAKSKEKWRDKASKHMVGSARAKFPRQ